MHFLCAQSSRSLAWFWRTSWLFNWFNCSLAKVDTRMKTIRLLSATHWHLGIKAGFFSPDRQIQNQFIFSILHHFHQKAGGYKVMFPNYQAKCSLWKLEMPKTVRWDLTEGLKCHTKLSWRPTGRAVIPLQDRFTGRYGVSEADCVQERERGREWFTALLCSRCYHYCSLAQRWELPGWLCLPLGKLYLPLAGADPVPWIGSLGGSEVEEDAVIAAWHRRR